MIDWILVKLGLRKPRWERDLVEQFSSLGWKWYPGYGTTITDSEWIILGKK